jgi:hypothetical protein
MGFGIAALTENLFWWVKKMKLSILWVGLKEGDSDRGSLFQKKDNNLPADICICGYDRLDDTAIYARQSNYESAV